MSPPLVSRLSGEAELAAVLHGWGLDPPAPVTVLVGGAEGLGARESRRCDRMFRLGLLPVLERLGARLVDGGTDSGVIALVGRARDDAGAQWPLVGVAAAGTVRVPDEPSRPGRVAVEPHHSHVLVVPGSAWGDEVPWLDVVARHLAAGAPAVTVLANGGDLAYADLRASLRAGRPVLVLSGTGRTADAVADAVAGRPADPRAVQLASSPLVTAVPLDPAALAAALTEALARP